MWSDAARQAAAEARSKAGRKPLPGHPYHQKSEAELRYIIKDASEAGKNAQDMGSMRGINKYADQVNDAATVLAYRGRGGQQEGPAHQSGVNSLGEIPPDSAWLEKMRGVTGTMSQLNQARRAALRPGGPGLKQQETDFARKWATELRGQHYRLAVERSQAARMRSGK